MTNLTTPAPTSSPSSTAAAPCRPSSAPSAGSSSAATASPCWPRTRWPTTSSDRRHLPPLEPGAQPARPPAGERPVPRLGVQEPDAALRPAARHAVRRAGARLRRRHASTAIADVRPDARGVLVLRGRRHGRRRRRPACPSTCCSRTRTCCRRPACRRWASACSPPGPARPPARSRPQRLHRPAVGEGPARAQRAPRRPRSRSRSAPSSTRSIGARRHPRADVGGLRLPGRAPGQRPLRRSGARRPDVGGARPWTPPAGDDPLVLVALSSTFQDHAGCLQRIVDALGTLPVRGLVTTGPALDPSEIARAGQRARSSPRRRTPRC